MFSLSAALIVFAVAWSASLGGVLAPPDGIYGAGEGDLAARSTVAAPRGSPRVTLRLHTGGTIDGEVAAHDGHGIVLVHGGAAYVFAWRDVVAGSAFVAKRACVESDRGGANRLSADDHFKLGVFALSVGRRDLAAQSFDVAVKRDRAYRSRAAEAIALADREAKERSGGAALTATDDQSSDEGLAGARDEANDVLPAAAAGESLQLVQAMTAVTRERVHEAYLTFGAKVKEVLGGELPMLESEHFLVWTDWEPRERDRLVDWCEGMYAALSGQLALSPGDAVFLAKCPVFAFRSKSKFVKFARHFDGFDVRNAIGYTRSLEASGHVHLVLYRPGREPGDFDRFACTLVHEGTHAFLHRLFSTRLIPHWINEGFAELMAERVLGDRCPNHENAMLLARQFVRFKWSLGDLTRDSGPIDVHQYALAHSLVAYLESLGAPRWAMFIRLIKEGKSTDDALASCYDGLTLERLERDWRGSILVANPWE